MDRRSWPTSIAYRPSIGKNIALAYLPHAHAQVRLELQIQYFADVYPVRVEAVGYKSLCDPENSKLLGVNQHAAVLTYSDHRKIRTLRGPAALSRVKFVYNLKPNCDTLSGAQINEKLWIANAFRDTSLILLAVDPWTMKGQTRLPIKTKANNNECCPSTQLRRVESGPDG